MLSTLQLTAGSLLIAVTTVATLGPPAVASDREEATRSVQRWMTAAVRSDHMTYLSLLSSDAQRNPEVASLEAMAFWADELEDLERLGFTGEWHIGKPRQHGAATALTMRPIVNGSPLSDAIVVVRQAGTWRLHRVFS